MLLFIDEINRKFINRKTRIPVVKKKIFFIFNEFNKRGIYKIPRLGIIYILLAIDKAYSSAKILLSTSANATGACSTAKAAASNKPG